MKKSIAVLFVLVGVLTTTALAGADFDRLKALEGQWEATTPEGKTRVIYQVISNGSALMETVVSENMVSIYHPDGNSILMTHYCAVGNQPRMRAQGVKGDTLTFTYVDAANLKGSADGHMYGLVIKFQDADHMTQEWTWKADGKETKSVFQLQRVK